MTPEQAEHIESMPPINLPWIFANGSCIANLTFRCSGCGKEIHSENVKGTIESTSASAPVAILRESYAICYSCRTISPHSEIRFDHEGGLLTRTEVGGWEKGTWGQKKTFGIIAKIFTFLSGKNKDNRHV